MAERDQLIVDYFYKGFSYKLIVALLYGNDGIKLSLRQLKRILARYGLFKRKSSCSLASLCDAVQDQLNCSGRDLGYRKMHHKFFAVYNIRTSHAIVRQIQKILDPEGVKRRKRDCLARRKYINKGPDYLWHLDGYDKLKPYGFCIHGCIDGYSRKLLWLESDSTNNCPKVIASYFLNYVKNHKGTARVIRADRGNENLNIAGIQRFLRRNGTDPMSESSSFLFGKSTSNQRIEAFWSQLRKTFGQWWMNYFKDMRDEGSWDESDPVHRECLKFSFGFVIRKELEEFKLLHNSHRIRPYAGQECPSGIPEILYSLPEGYGSRHYTNSVNSNDMNVALRYSRNKSIFGCSEEFEKIGLLYIGLYNNKFPTTAHEGRSLYEDLIRFIESI